jgi:hypothetical protein
LPPLGLPSKSNKNTLKLVGLAESTKSTTAILFLLVEVSLFTFGVTAIPCTSTKSTLKLISLPEPLLSDSVHVPTPVSLRIFVSSFKFNDVIFLYLPFVELTIVLYFTRLNCVPNLKKDCPVCVTPSVVNAPLASGAVLITP